MSFAIRLLPLVIFVEILDVVSPGLAVDLQHPRYQLQDRTNAEGRVDRTEGIKPLEISGERLALVAVLLNAMDKPVGTTSDLYRVGFFLKTAEEGVTVEVRDYNFFGGKYRYWMRPRRKGYDRGFREFTWDDGLARELGLRVEDLGVLAWLGGHGRPIVSPALISAAPFPAIIRVRGCQFIFVPNETMTVEYRLFPKEKQTQVFLESGEETWNKDQRTTLSWDGRGYRSAPATEGAYVLRLTAKLAAAGRPTEQIPYDYEFYYTPYVSTRH